MGIKTNQHLNNKNPLNTNRVLIVTYGNPIENPGPAMFAWELKKRLNQTQDIFFLGTYQTSPPENYGFSETYFKIQNSKEHSGPLGKIYQRYFHIEYIFFLIRKIKSYRVNIVNFHNLGMSIPLLVFPVLRLMNIQTIATFHDYTNVYNRKLYPSDLKTHRTRDLRSLVTRIMNEIVLKTNRKMFKLASNIVYLSPDQKSIYAKFRFPDGEVIENKIEDCKCEYVENGSRDKPNIVFIGRRIGKGLDSLIDWIRHQDVFQLTLVGGKDLAQIAQARLRSHQFEFLGKLPPKEVYLAIHNSTLLYAVSDCLDVYPTTVLEAIVHGIPVLVSKNCGNHHLVSEINPSFIIDEIAEFTPSELLKMLETWNGKKRTSSKVSYICDFSQQIVAYEKLFRG